MRTLREALRYVAIGLGFGLIWAVIQYTNGQITNFKTLGGLAITFGAAGLMMWGIRRAVIAIRAR